MRGPICYHSGVRAIPVLLLAAAFPGQAAERQLLDEVVAVVEAHSITLSEVAAETRVRLVESQGPAAANAPLDRRILAASLRTTIEERIVGQVHALLKSLTP